MQYYYHLNLSPTYLFIFCWQLLSILSLSSIPSSTSVSSLVRSASPVHAAEDGKAEKNELLVCQSFRLSLTNNHSVKWQNSLKILQETFWHEKQLVDSIKRLCIQWSVQRIMPGLKMCLDKKTVHRKLHINKKWATHWATGITIGNAKPDRKIRRYLKYLISWCINMFSAENKISCHI